MKITCTFLFATVITFLIGFTSLLPAAATHITGIEISYVNVGPNVYIVKFKTYSSCNSTAFSQNHIFTYRAPGCNNNLGNITLQHQSSQNTSQYCPSSNNCIASASLPLDFTFENTYTGTLSFPTQCPNWILSNRNDGRSPARNLAFGAQEWIYSGATINNVFTFTNNSPVWGAIPGLVFGVDQVVNFSYNITSLL